MLIWKVVDFLLMYFGLFGREVVKDDGFRVFVFRCIVEDCLYCDGGCLVCWKFINIC